MPEPTKAQIAWLKHAKAYGRAMIEQARRDEFCRQNPFFHRRYCHFPLGRQVLAEAREREAGREG